MCWFVELVSVQNLMGKVFVEELRSEFLLVGAELLHLMTHYFLNGYLCYS